MITGKLPETIKVTSNIVPETLDSLSSDISVEADSTEFIVRSRLSHKSKMDPERLDSLVHSSATPEPSDDIDQSFEKTESSVNIACQISGPLFIAGICMVGAGIYLEYIRSWTVFMEVDEIIVLVPALLGLKGNLEMTLASRLSTEANLGKMNESKEKWSLIAGNLALIQCQAIVVGLLASIVTIIFQFAKNYTIDPHHALLLCACSIITASIASFFLGALTCSVVVLSTHVNIDPDNVATPIAAGLGDLTSLLLLSWIASGLYECIRTHEWIAILAIVMFLASLPLWTWIAKTNKYTKKVLMTGWSPIIAAMMISTVGGMALDVFIDLFPAIPAFQPVVNGVGGNLVSIQASRLSTTLHKSQPLGQLPPNEAVVRLPCHIFQADATHYRSSRVLIALVIPFQLFFSLSIVYIKTGSMPVGPVFFSVYLLATLLQVALLLYICYILNFFLWKKKINPDNTSIPYLTAIGDLLGIVLLGIAFYILKLTGENYRLDY